MERCTKVVDRMSAIVDGEAGFTAWLMLHAHLMMCVNCRTYYSQFMVVKEASETVRPQDLPEDFGKVMEFVMKEIDEG